jgi:BASS family bile acid:Na+ symporter
VTGLVLASIGNLDHQQKMTIGIEVGVQNATIAIFLTLTILDSIDLSVGPTIYGVIMVFNASVVVKLLILKQREPASILVE